LGARNLFRGRQSCRVAQLVNRFAAMLRLRMHKTASLQLAVRALALAATALVLPSCTPWKHAQPTAGGFTVQMPGNASCNFARGPKEFGQLPGSVCRGDARTWRSKGFGIFMASGYALPLNQDLEAVVRASANEIRAGVRDSGSVVVADEQRTIDGAVWSVITMEGGEARNRFRTVYLSTARQEGAFALSVTGPASAWPAEDAERFIASFRFQGRPGDFNGAQRK
jgi:hypothetical protein